MKLASVLLVDDDQFTLTTLKHALQGLNIHVIDTVSTAAQAIDIVTSNEVEVAILDLDLGLGASGIDIAHALRKLQPKIGIILLTSYTDPRVSDPSAREIPPGTIFLTKSKISEIQILISSIISVRQDPLRTKRKQVENVPLTNRQLEVLKLLANGMSTQEISVQLYLSEKSVEAIITKLHSDLGLERRKGLNMRIQLTRAYFALSGKKPPGA